MRTTIDIPDELYRQLKMKAVVEGQTVRTLAVRAIERELDAARRGAIRRLAAPLLPAHAPGSIDVENEQIHELIALP